MTGEVCRQGAASLLPSVHGFTRFQVLQMLRVVLQHHGLVHLFDTEKTTSYQFSIADMRVSALVMLAHCTTCRFMFGGEGVCAAVQAQSATLLKCPSQMSRPRHAGAGGVGDRLGPSAPAKKLAIWAIETITYRVWEEVGAGGVTCGRRWWALSALATRLYWS